MDRSRWWRDKASIYAGKIRADLDNRKRTKKVQAELMDVVAGLENASKMFNDWDALEFLSDLDRRVYEGEFSPTASKIITKCVL